VEYTLAKSPKMGHLGGKLVGNSWWGGGSKGLATENGEG